MQKRPFSENFRYPSLSGEFARSLPPSLVVPIHRGARGVHDPGQPGHPVAAIPHVDLRHRACRRPYCYSDPGVRPNAARNAVTIALGRNSRRHWQSE